ncbi:hypothetical protein BH23BAC4_BH23BAC4_05860 [soil metagenome]
MRARAANPASRLTPGSFAEVALVFERVADAAMIPTVAVTAGADSNWVYTVRDGRAFRRGILTGVRTGDMIQVVEGLSVGDTVLTSGFDELRPGQPVRIDWQGLTYETDASQTPPDATRGAELNAR